MEMGMRPARLGLGAKQERKVAGSESVAGNLALKKQLTGNAGVTNHSNIFGAGAGAGVVKKKSNEHVKQSKNVQKRREFDNDDCGRASMLKNSSKK